MCHVSTRLDPTSASFWMFIFFYQGHNHRQWIAFVSRALKEAGALVA